MDGKYVYSLRVYIAHAQDVRCYLPNFFAIFLHETIHLQYCIMGAANVSHIRSRDTVYCALGTPLPNYVYRGLSMGAFSKSLCRGANQPVYPQHDVFLQ